MRREKVTITELNRRAESVVRCIMENPGLAAAAIGRRLGHVSAREVRERVRRAREMGHPIVIGVDGKGYYHLETIDDAKLRATLVNCHMDRSRAYAMDHFRLCRQIGKLTEVAIAQLTMLDFLVPPEEGEAKEDRPVSMKDLAQLPPIRRAGVLKLLHSMLEGIAADPTAFAVERAALAEKFGPVFLTGEEAKKLDQARKLLGEIGSGGSLN